MRRLLATCAIVALAGACSPADEAQQARAVAAAPTKVAPAATEAPSGDYTLDKAHASLIFRMNHIGFSNYTAQFTAFDAKLTLDTKSPEASRVTATIDPRSLLLNTPPTGFVETILGAKWLDVARFPTMSFASTKVEPTGPNTARVTGDFTFHGVTKPVVLEVTFNGGYAGHAYEPQARIGFSARGGFKRSEFGVAYGLPPPGTTMGLGDAVTFEIEAEFNGPPLKSDAPTQ